MCQVDQPLGRDSRQGVVIAHVTIQKVHESLLCAVSDAEMDGTYCLPCRCSQPEVNRK